MKKNITKQDRLILTSFLENSIPEYIKWGEDTKGFDLMECYEELFSYSHNLLDGYEIDVKVNSLGGNVFVFNQDYKNTLLKLANETDNKELAVHCYLSLAVLVILLKYAKK